MLQKSQGAKDCGVEQSLVLRDLVGGCSFAAVGLADASLLPCYLLHANMRQVPP